jgi:hypothetical protein
MQFDLDNDTLTGFWPWTHKGIGTEVLIEANITTGSTRPDGAYTFDITTPTQNDWAWIPKTMTDYMLFGYRVQVGDKVQVEWAVRKSKLDANTTNGNVVLGNKVTMILNHYDVGWNPVDFFPGSGENAFILEMM